MINNRLDGPIHNFYSHVVGQYWDSARHHVENGYRDISFPFGNIQTPAFYIDQRWTLKHLCGYLESWSATQRYILDKKENPVHAVAPVLREFWGNEETLPIRFPVFLKLGRVN